jgi:hypothetical protein
LNKSIGWYIFYDISSHRDIVLKMIVMWLIMDIIAINNKRFSQVSLCDTLFKDVDCKIIVYALNCWYTERVDIKLLSSHLVTTNSTTRLMSGISFESWITFLKLLWILFKLITCTLELEAIII